LIASVFLPLAFISLIVQLVFQILIRSGLKKIESNSDNNLTGPRAPLSVIIVARNEKGNLKKYLPSVLASEYEFFELVLVDDYSTDNTKAIMDEFAAKDKRVIVVGNKGKLKGKKGALTTGVQAATHDNLVFTDADCYVTSEWLTHFALAYESGSDFVIGHGAYDRGRSWFSEFYSFNAHKSAMLYFASAAYSMPYMCVGRSMGYKKSLFLSSNGFTDHANIESGSDDLFLQTVKGSAKIALNPQAISFSKAPSSIKRWIIQRRRHLGAGRYYPFKVLALIFAYEISNLLIPLVYLFLLFTKSDHLPLLTLLLIVRIVLFRSNTQVFSSLVKSNDDISQLWWSEYPMSWLNALISVNIGLMKKEAWTTRR